MDRRRGCIELAGPMSRVSYLLKRAGAPCLCLAALALACPAAAGTETAPGPAQYSRPAQYDAAGRGPLTVTAQSSDPFSALVGKRKKRRADRAVRSKIERYVLATDDRSFLFEASANEARIKFLCSAGDPRIECAIDSHGPAEEIYRLTPNRGPRGDIIYRNYQDETLLRIASYGGATVFWPGDREGSAASKSFGDVAGLTLSGADYETAMRRAHSATALISAATGAPIVFHIGPPPAGEAQNAAVLADAVVMAAKALHGVAADPTGARIIANRISHIRFEAAEEPGVALEDQTWKINYIPVGDIEARPSSAALRQFLEESL